MQRIAVLGLGIMGAGMASNWLDKGFTVSVWNRSRARAEPFAAKGARVAGTPREAAEGAELIVAMVSDDEASRSVWLGPDGALAGAEAGAIAAESSTLSPGWIRELAAATGEKGLSFLDMPVGGSRDAAESGNLVLFVGGDDATLERARPALAAISNTIHHLGGTAAGATWKLINNMMGAAQITAAAEGLALAEKLGLDRRQVAAINATAGTSSPIVKMKMPRIAELDFADPDFSLGNMTKDIRYAMALAAEKGMVPETGKAALKRYEQAMAEGLGGNDVAAVYQTVDR
ncbi:MAG: NAD(P)-dependent oxidoreductase [Bauldia sp.]|nr:NAD(P)-dependent oxidoreductase [Bauldia sp.]